MSNGFEIEWYAYVIDGCVTIEAADVLMADVDSTKKQFIVFTVSDENNFVET